MDCRQWFRWLVVSAIAGLSALAPAALEPPPAEAQQYAVSCVGTGYIWADPTFYAFQEAECSYAVGFLQIGTYWSECVDIECWPIDYPSFSGETNTYYVSQLSWTSNGTVGHRWATFDLYACASSCGYDASSAGPL